MLALSAICLTAADSTLAADLEKLKSSYRSDLEELHEQAVAAADLATAKSIENALAQLPTVPAGKQATTPTASLGALDVGSKWQGNVNVKKDRDAVNYAAKATVLESDASGFTLAASFLDRQWIYKFKKDAAGKLELASAEAMAGAGLTKGITKISASKIEVVTDATNEVMRIRTVRKDGNNVIDASYELRPEP